MSDTSSKIDPSVNFLTSIEDMPVKKRPGKARQNAAESTEAPFTQNLAQWTDQLMPREPKELASRLVQNQVPERAGKHGLRGEPLLAKPQTKAEASSQSGSALARKTENRFVKSVSAGNEAPDPAAMRATAQTGQTGIAGLDQIAGKTIRPGASHQTDALADVKGAKPGISPGGPRSAGTVPVDGEPPATNAATASTTMLAVSGSGAAAPSKSASGGVPPTAAQAGRSAGANRAQPEFGKAHKVKPVGATGVGATEGQAAALPTVPHFTKTSAATDTVSAESLKGERKAAAKGVSKREPVSTASTAVAGMSPISPRTNFSVDEVISADTSLSSSIGPSSGVNATGMAGLSAVASPGVVSTPHSETAGSMSASELTAMDLPGIDAPIDHPDFKFQLSDRVTLAIRNDTEQARIRVSPEELGPIQIEVSIDGPQAFVRFSAAHAETCDAIRASLDQLRDSLREQGLELGGAQVSDQGQPTPERQYRYAEASENRYDDRVGGATVDASERGSEPNRTSNSGLGTVDLFV